MAILEVIANFAAQNLILFFFVTVICTALWGDATLIGFIVLSMILKIPLWIVLIGCYVGTLIGDMIWFAIGVSLRRKIEKSKKWEAGFRKIAYYFDKIFGKKIILTLSIVKMLYGTRVIAIFYIAKERIKFKKFILANLVATLVWLVIIGGIGYLIGIGFTYLIKFVKGAQIAIVLFILFIIAFDLIQKRINKDIELKISNNKRKKRKAEK